MAGGIVTVVGSQGGPSIPVTVNGAQAFTLAQAYASAVLSASAAGSYFSSNVASGSTAPAAPGSSVNELIATGGGVYTYAAGYDHFITNTTAHVTIDASAASAGTMLTTLVGTGGATYIAGNESGTFIAGGGNNAFINSGAGAYTVATSDGNDTIIAGSGSSTIDAGTGNNLITLGSGNANVTSEGTDRILLGTGSDTLTISGNLTTVYGGTGASSIQASTGTNTTFVLNGVSTVFAGTGDTISASAATTVFGANQVNVSEFGTGALTFIAGTDAAATVNAGLGSTTIFGSNNSNITFTGGNGSSHSVLVAGAGNETLNGSGSTVGFAGFVSNTTGSGGVNSIAGGTGADTLVAGLGQQTLTGGSGAGNLFVIAANGTAHGSGAAPSITISDFGSASSNMVGLFGYGANEVSDALKTAMTTNGNTTIKLNDGTTVTFDSVSTLDPTKFISG